MTGAYGDYAQQHQGYSLGPHGYEQPLMMPPQALGWGYPGYLGQAPSMPQYMGWGYPGLLRQPPMMPQGFSTYEDPTRFESSNGHRYVPDMNQAPGMNQYWAQPSFHQNFSYPPSFSQASNPYQSSGQQNNGYDSIYPPVPSPYPEEGLE